jgi:Holliday junction resolvasome RuvABC ATP-dependent DNA helicase subunit
MKFIGQNHIVTEIAEYIPQILQGTNLNLLFRGQSGYGKTTLAFNILNTILQYSPQTGYSYSLPNKDGFVEINENNRIQIVDECHLIPHPEFLYPYMDSGRFFFIFCSNEAGELKEPLVNRCIAFNFINYTQEELCSIIDEFFTKNSIKLPETHLQLIYRNCNGVPRIAKNISQRLLMIIMNKGIPDETELLRIINEVFQLQDGLDYRHRTYINFLQHAKVASLDLISYATKLDKATILREIEPVLIYKDLISISSRGRKWK